MSGAVLLVAAQDSDSCAEAGELDRHRLAEAGPAARDDDDFPTLTAELASSMNPVLSKDEPGSKIVVPPGIGLFTIMLPVTMLVPVLKETVADRFGTGTFWTHSFMSFNLAGAVLAAPLAGPLANRLGHRRVLVCIAALANALGGLRM